MKCEQVEVKLISLVYGELTPQEQAEIEQHLADCEPCEQQAAKLNKAHALLEEAVSEQPATRELPIAQVTRRAVELSERSRRRWQVLAGLTGLAAAVLVVLQLLTIRIEIDQSHVEIAWGTPERTETPSPAPPNPGPISTQRLLPVVDEHQERLEDLDRLVHFLIRLKEADSRARDRGLAAVSRRVDSLQKQNETWQRTLSFLLRNARLSNDLAHQPITPTRLEGDFE